WKVHTHCRSRIGDSCGLTPEHLRILFDKLVQQNNGASWNEVNIPFQKIDFEKNSLIGHGRFGDVLRGYHFGDVAVKFLNMNHIEESRRLDEFKSEVTAHKNTRHDNIVLFLGYCIESDKFGIVMSLCKGRPLHHILHETNEAVDLGTALIIATQICQHEEVETSKQLIQLGVETGEHDEYTTEMMEWWLLEADLIDKMHK
ncbi:hypothetical protein TELCIR_19412, partial [Teladorsagia circumcincta]